jgi:hypothetical protein
LRQAALTPASRSAATWSCISAIRGETTMPQPSRISAGIWKHSDLPPPVGISTSASPPFATCSMISPCLPRNDGKPKTDWRIERAWVTSCYLRVFKIADKSALAQCRSTHFW